MCEAVRERATQARELIRNHRLVYGHASVSNNTILDLVVAAICQGEKNARAEAEAERQLQTSGLVSFREQQI